MQTTPEQLEAIKQIREEYMRELATLSAEQKTAVANFLERARQKKIAAITAQIRNTNQNS